MELTELYSQNILAIASRLVDLPPLEQPDATARKVSRICGSVVEVALTLSEGVVSAYSHKISACALGQTSAAVMAAHVLGATPAELRQVRAEMTAMLKAEGPPPAGERWQELRFLEPVRTYPARHASTLLVFEAVNECIDRIESAQLAGDPG